MHINKAQAMWYSRINAGDMHVLSWVNPKIVWWKVTFKDFFKAFIYWLTWEREHAHMQEKGCEGQADSPLKMEPNVGLNCSTLRSWPKPMSEA